MDLLQLQYFRTIARLENLTKAGELLFVAQPNLSVSMKRLEDDLGVALFERRHGKIRLTETGRLFLGYVEQTLDQLDGGIAAARAFSQKNNQQMRVASSIVDLMSRLLTPFLQKHPDVSFHQIGCTNAEIEEKVLDGEADLGFLFGGATRGGLEYIELDSCQRVVQLAADHPLAGKRILSLHELADTPIICNHARDDRALLDELARTAGFQARQIYECDDDRVAAAMTAAGGVNLTPVSNYLKLRHYASDVSSIAVARVRETLPRARIGMVRRSGNLLSNAELAFFEMVAGHFREEHARARAFEEELQQL